MKTRDSLSMMVYTALFAALTAAGAFIAIPIPITPVPIVLQNLFVLLTGVILGPRWGLASVGLYLFMGALGFPVFAGGTGGFGRLFGPTGGYLLGYIPAVWVTGFLSRKLGGSRTGDGVAMTTGALIVYAAGVPWLHAATGMDWPKALAAGMYPFLIGDALKVAAGILTAPIIKPLVKQP
jgi:biotin transport system substrate-specific component